MPDLNCLIVEDEPLAAGILEEYISQVPGLRLSGSSVSAMAAIETLRSGKIDIIFLDINLPGINGIDFLKSMRGQYDIVLTTAYHQYAIESYELNVTDYLLKPVEFSRFLLAVNRIFEKRQVVKPEPGPEGKRQHYFFNVDKKQVKVFPDEILYIESLKDYVCIHSLGKKLVTKYQIGEIERMLGSAGFIRIHKSYVVNVEKITAYNATDIELDDVSLPIGRSYKELVERRLK